MLKAQIVAPEPPQKVEAFVYTSWQPEVIPLLPDNGTATYRATIPTDKLKAGYLHYQFVITDAQGQAHTYPAGTRAHPRE